MIEFEKNKSNAYLPTIYIKKGNIEKRKGNKKVSFEFYQKASLLAEKTENKQAQVLCFIAKKILIVYVDGIFIIHNVFTH